MVISSSLFLHRSNADPRPGETEKEINIRKAKLSDLIVQVLRQHPMLCYFQGYHDIVQVLLLVLGERAAPVAVARISLLRIRDYMLPSLSPALKHLQVLPAILERADPPLAAHLARTRPFFALAATLTLYAHDIQEYSDIARLFDFILAHEPVMAIYTFAAIIISRRSELLDISVDEPEMLHFALSKLPQPLDLEELISSTLGLFQRHPPECLPRFTWWKICSNSVLKTSRLLGDKQSLEHGEALFYSQARRLQREELQQKVLVLAWKYRRPAGSVAAAVLVGAASLWLRRSGQDKFIWNFLWKAQGMLGFKTSS
jgi:TBC1 domain family member 20